MHRHLRRLERVWIDWPVYFITTCTFHRKAILASNKVAGIIIDEWRNAHNRHGWAIGRYVIMPACPLLLSGGVGRQGVADLHAEVEGMDE
jgi:hypothetical protein